MRTLFDDDKEGHLRVTDIQRLAGIVVSPATTFGDIGRRPTWVVPFLLLIAVNLTVTYVVYRVLVTDSNLRQVAEAKIQWDASAHGKVESQQDIERGIEAVRQQRERWYLLPPYAVLVSTLGISIFFYVVLWIAKADTTFPKVFSVVCWSFPIYRVLGIWFRERQSLPMFTRLYPSSTSFSYGGWA